MQVEQLVADPIEVPAHLLLAGHEADILDRAAQLAGLLVQRHEMAALRRDARRFHARRTAADNGHLHRLVRARICANAGLPQAGLIEQAISFLAIINSCQQPPRQLDALADRLDPAVLRLDRP